MNKYTAYGYRQKEANASEISYNGDYEIDGLFLMGNGYRLYSPQIRRFYSPDSMSPGEAGVNPYTYNLGDPINRSDPSGHLSVGQWISIGLGIAGILVSVLSLGLGAAAGAGMITLASGTFLASMAATSVTSVVVESIGLVAGAVALASEFSDNKQLKKAGEILGYVSFGLAIGPSIAKGVSKGVTKAVSKLSNKSYNSASYNSASYNVAKQSSTLEIGNLDDIIKDRNKLGTGNFGTAYKYNDRVYKIPHHQSGNRTVFTDPERQKRIWNEIYSTLYNGSVSHYATATVQKLRNSDGEIVDIFSSPFIEGVSGIKNLNTAKVYDLVSEININNGRKFLDYESNGNIIKEKITRKHLPVDMDLMISMIPNSPASNRFMFPRNSSESGTIIIA